MTTRTFATRTVADLHVQEWEGTGPTVLGLPGLGSTGLAWSWLAEQLGDHRVVAPDLRGRGGSQHLTGPIGLAAHAQDVARVAQELDLTDVVVVGHSMGAYLAPVVARALGDRVSRLVLVDGGIPPKLPFFMGPRVVRASFRMQLKKFDKDWESADALMAKARGKMLDARPDLAPLVRDLLAADLGGQPGALRPRVDVQRASQDAADTFFGPSVVPALEALAVPAHALLATHKAGATDKAFIGQEQADAWTARQPLLTAERVESNHVTIMFTDELTAAVRG